MRGPMVFAAMIVCMVAGSACSDKNRVPGDILPLDKMEQVMWDMAQADQYVLLYLAKDSAHNDRKSETLRLYEEVFRLHQVTREEFRKSYRYYLDHPALNQVLFDSIMARGVRARTEQYDRPTPYRPPVTPGKPVVGTNPGNLGRPGLLPGPAGDAVRRAREAMARREDSIRKAVHRKPDTTRGQP